MLIHSIKLNRFLSYGPTSEAIPLNALNLIIGTNGSGKSNLLSAIDLIRGAPKDLPTPISDGGGVRDWLWKGGEGTPTAAVEVVVSNPRGPANLRYGLSFTEVGQRFQLTRESIENEHPDTGHETPTFYYRFQGGRGILNVKGKKRSLQLEDIDQNQSILSQRRDPDQYPEITYLAQALSKIRLYRDASFGPVTALRLPQKADLPNDALAADAANLGLVLNRLRREPSVKERTLKALRTLYEGIDDYDVQVEGGTVQVFIQEGRFIVPATRLSDGTLRYLCLLAILCHPKPPPLVCIEEPELGLHPDILPTVAELLKEASERCQLIVTTHSDVLVNCMHDEPESVLVAEKDDNGTRLKRLKADELKPWLEKYRLGELWMSGDLGGTRW